MFSLFPLRSTISPRGPTTASPSTPSPSSHSCGTRQTPARRRPGPSWCTAGEINNNHQRQKRSCEIQWKFRPPRKYASKIVCLFITRNFDKVFIAQHGFVEQIKYVSVHDGRKHEFFFELFCLERDSVPLPPDSVQKRKIGYKTVISVLNHVVRRKRL